MTKTPPIRSGALRKTFEEWCCTVLATGTLNIGRKMSDGKYHHGSFQAVKYLDPKQGSVEERFYILGTRIAHSKRTYYRFADDDRDWYVACHSPDVIQPEFADAHPFGPSVVVMPWSDSSDIDLGYRSKANRCPVEFIPSTDGQNREK